MTAYADLLRRFWLPGLNGVEFRQAKADLRAWIAQEDFQVYSPAGNPAVLSFVEHQPICEAMATEALRMSLAACESVASIHAVGGLPRSKAWAIVQWYYAAFYAAHAILRMCGVALIQLEAPHANSIRRIADAFGQPCTVSHGYHSVVVKRDLRELHFAKMDTDGSHELLWKHFAMFLERASRELLSAGGASLEEQELATRLDDLRGILNTRPAKAGSWLSHVRNRVNYRQQFAAWYPYTGHLESDLAMFKDIRPVPSNAHRIALAATLNARPLDAFSSAARFIVALCRDMAVEMARRSTATNHFHVQGIVQLESLLRGT